MTATLIDPVLDAADAEAVARLARLTPEQFRARYVVHQDLREAPESRVTLLMTEGFSGGMAEPDTLDGPQDGLHPRAPMRGHRRFAGLEKAGSIVYVCKASALQRNSAWLRHGARPLAVVRLGRDEQTVHEALVRKALLRGTAVPAGIRQRYPLLVSGPQAE